MGVQANLVEFLRDEDMTEFLPALIRLVADGEPVPLPRLAAAADVAEEWLAAWLRGQPETDWDEQDRLLGFGLTQRDPSPVRRRRPGAVHVLRRGHVGVPAHPGSVRERDLEVPFFATDAAAEQWRQRHWQRHVLPIKDFFDQGLAATRDLGWGCCA